jgi:hypothetical protein
VVEAGVVPHHQRCHQRLTLQGAGPTLAHSPAAATRLRAMAEVATPDRHPLAACSWDSGDPVHPRGGNLPGLRAMWRDHWAAAPRAACLAFSPCTWNGGLTSCPAAPRRS